MFYMLEKKAQFRTITPRNASKPPHPPSGEQNNKAVDNGDHHFRECKPETKSIIANSHRDRDK